MLKTETKTKTKGKKGITVSDAFICWIFIELLYATRHGIYFRILFSSRTFK